MKTSHTPKQIKARLEYLRGELRAERISYAEIAELESLAQYIEPGDVELLEAAGVPEGCPHDFIPANNDGAEQCRFCGERKTGQ